MPKVSAKAGENVHNAGSACPKTGRRLHRLDGGLSSICIVDRNILERVSSPYPQFVVSLRPGRFTVTGRYSSRSRDPDPEALLGLAHDTGSNTALFSWLPVISVHTLRVVVAHLRQGVEGFCDVEKEPTTNIFLLGQSDRGKMGSSVIGVSYRLGMRKDE